MPPSLSGLFFSSLKFFDSTQRAKASKDRPAPAMEIQMETLKPRNPPNNDTTRQTSPSSPRSSPAAGSGGGRTYSRYGLPQSQSSSWLMQSHVHQNHHNRSLSSTSSQQQQQQQQQQQLQQQLQTALQEQISSSTRSPSGQPSRPSSIPASRRCSMSGLVPLAPTSRLDERMLANTGDSYPLPLTDSNVDDERMNEQEGKASEVEGKEGDRSQQEDQAPPLTTADTPRCPSPLLTTFSASHSPCSSSRSSVSSSSSTMVGQTGTPKRVLTPPLYLDEEAVKSLPFAEALAIFQDQPLLTTPREFVEAVAWDSDTCTSRSYLVIDDDAKGARNSRRKVRKGSKTGKISEDYEMQDLKFNSPNGKRV